MKWCKSITAYALFFMMALSGKPAVVYGYQLDFSYVGARMVKKEKNREIYKTESGSLIYKYREREEARLSNGTKIIRYANGKREVYPPDGVKILIDYDGSALYLYPDGRQKSVSMDGFTPFGMKIKGEVKRIRVKGVSVEIVYSAELSDDLMSKYIRTLYDEIAVNVKRIIERKKTRGKQFRIVISNCRFGRTGYCRRKNRKGLVVMGFRGEKMEFESNIKDKEIYSEKESRKFARNIVEKILSD